MDTIGSNELSARREQLQKVCATLKTLFFSKNTIKLQNSFISNKEFSLGLGFFSGGGGEEVVGWFFFSLRTTTSYSHILSYKESLLLHSQAEFTFPKDLKQSSARNIRRLLSVKLHSFFNKTDF